MIHLWTLLLSLVKGQSTQLTGDCLVVGDIWNYYFEKDLVVTDQSCCFGIPGIVCENGNVTEIDWTRQKLQGSIPALLGDLIHLKKLFLSANRLSGQIPLELKNLKELTLLDLGYNQITGLGDVLSSLTALEGVSVWYNLLSGDIPDVFENLSKLKGIWFENNQLTGEVPISMSLHQDMTVIDIRRNPNLEGVVKMTAGELGISDTAVQQCDDGSTDLRCRQILSLLESDRDRLPMDLGFEEETNITTNTSVEIAPAEPQGNTTTTGSSLDTNGYIIGGLVGATGLVATTLLIIFRAPKSVRSDLDSPDLETVTEHSFPDIVELPEVTEDIMFEPGTNLSEIGPAAADIDAVFPSIFSNILGDLSKN